MEEREKAQMRKYGESKTTRIMMATVPHITSGLGLRKFQADGFLLTRVYNKSAMKTAETSLVQNFPIFSYSTVTPHERSRYIETRIKVAFPGNF